MCRPLLVFVFLSISGRRLRRSGLLGRGGVFLRTETINSIGDTYIHMVLLGWANPGVCNSGGEIDRCIKGGKLLGERWFVAGSRWEVDRRSYCNTFLLLAIVIVASIAVDWETLSSQGGSFGRL